MSTTNGFVIFDDFLEQLKKVFMEITGIFTLGVRLGGLDEGRNWFLNLHIFAVAVKVQLSVRFNPGLIFFMISRCNGAIVSMLACSVRDPGSIPVLSKCFLSFGHKVAKIAVNQARWIYLAGRFQSKKSRQLTTTSHAIYWQVKVRWFVKFLFSILSVPNEVSVKLIEAAFQTNANILKTDNSKVWKYFPTKEFQEICRGQNFIEETSLRYIQSQDPGKRPAPFQFESSGYWRWFRFQRLTDHLMWEWDVEKGPIKEIYRSLGAKFCQHSWGLVLLAGPWSRS